MAALATAGQTEPGPYTSTESPARAATVLSEPVRPGVSRIERLAMPMPVSLTAVTWITWLSAVASILTTRPTLMVPPALNDGEFGRDMASGLSVLVLSVPVSFGAAY